MMGMGEVVLVMLLMAGGIAPEPVRWLGKIAVTSGVPLGMMSLGQRVAMSGPIMQEVPAPPPPPPMRAPPPPKPPPPAQKKAL